MNQDLKDRTKIIDGVKYVLPLNVQWRTKERAFMVTTSVGSGEETRRRTFSYSVSRNGSMATAFTKACEKAEEQAKLMGRTTTYAEFKLSEEQRQELRDIHICFTSVKNPLSVSHILVVNVSETELRRRKSFTIGRAGYYTEQRFRDTLHAAKEWRRQQLEELQRQAQEAANDEQIDGPRLVRTSTGLIHRLLG